MKKYKKIDVNTKDLLRVFIRNYISEVLKAESKLEKAKTELTLRRDFSVASAFTLFSSNLQKKINKKDFIEKSQRLGISQQEKEIELLYKRYDSNQDGQLGFQEFSNLFSPCNPLYRQELEQRTTIYTMSIETLDIFKHLLILLIDTEILAE
jgi:hypothetical protein